MNDAVLVKIEGPVATITLNRPQAYNALDKAMVDGLRTALSDLEHDRSARVVVLTGAGPAFMAGGDIRAFATMMNVTPAEREQAFERFINDVHPSIVIMRRMRQPILASIRGPVAGFGMSLMMACDLAIAAEDSIFTLAYAMLGTSPDGGSTWSLPRLVGLRRAMEIALLSDRFDAPTAERWGLLNKVVPAADLDTATAKLAARLAAGPADAFAATKRLLLKSIDSPLEVQLQAEADAFAHCAGTEDFREGVAAFLEKRKPDFK